MKSVVFFLYDLRIGGAEKVIVQLSNYFINIGYKVSILTISSKKNSFKDTLNPKIKIHSLKKVKIKYSFFPLIKFWKENKFDIFIANIWPLTLLSIICKFFFKNRKLILIEHCNLTMEFKNKSFLFKFFMNKSISLFYNFSHKVIAVSNGVKTDLITKGVKKNIIQTIYNPFFLLKKKDKEFENDLVYFENFIGSKFLCVGNLKKQKNYKFLLDTLNIYREKNNEKFLCYILGNGNQKQFILDKILQYNLTKNVKIISNVKNPYYFYKACDIFLLPSLYEGFGIVLVEALSLGKTVVSTDCKSGPSEIIGKNEYGYLCSVNNKEDLYNNIIKALNNPIIEEKAKSRAIEFSIDNIAIQYINLIKTI